jgi:putative transposase
MYGWWKLSPDEQFCLTMQRLQKRFPAHEVPHRKGMGSYFITAACFEDQPLMTNPQRRRDFADAMLRAATEWAEGRVHGWVVLRNHYHVVWEGAFDLLSRAINRLHSGAATQWNREDKLPGRRAFFRFSDRQIRSEAHFCASLNYAHGNPVKHGWAARADAWDTTSLHTWLEKAGRPAVARMWRSFPIDRYGEGWDD